MLPMFGLWRKIGTGATSRRLPRELKAEVESLDSRVVPSILIDTPGAPDDGGHLSVVADEYGHGFAQLTYTNPFTGAITSTSTQLQTNLVGRTLVPIPGVTGAGYPYPYPNPLTLAYRLPTPVVPGDVVVQHFQIGQGFDLRLISWGDGSGVPTSGNSLVIVGIDSNDLLHIRIYDAAGNRITDTDETKLPVAQAGAIAYLKLQLTGLLPPHVLTDAEKVQVIGEATSIVGQTPGQESDLIRYVDTADPIAGVTGYMLVYSDTGKSGPAQHAPADVGLPTLNFAYNTQFVSEFGIEGFDTVHYQSKVIDPVNTSVSVQADYIILSGGNLISATGAKKS